MREHNYLVENIWTGNKGTGTSGYKEYDRSHLIRIKGKQDLNGSSDTPFMGDSSRHNPEDLFLASLSACHMLWYLHLCADSGIVVVEYRDLAAGTMCEVNGGGGHFTSVVLNPEVIITEASKIEEAINLHDEARKKCFIANSCNFPVSHQAKCSLK